MTRFLVLAFLVGCGGGGGGGSGGDDQPGADAGHGSGSGGNTDHAACVIPESARNSDDGTICTELKQGSAQNIHNYTAMCTSVPGTTSTDVCPTANLLGCCTNTIPNFGLEVGCTYADSGRDAADLESACVSQMGTWSTTP